MTSPSEGRGTLTLKSAFDQVAEWYPEREAFVQAGGDASRRYTYEAANDEARRFANGLASLGVERGDRVAFLSWTTVEHAVATVGVWKLGAVATTVHAREGRETIRASLADVAPTVVVFQPQLADRLAPIADTLPSVERFVAFDGLGDVPAFAIPYTGVVEGETADEPDVTVSPGDRATINFSSGTVTRPKPIVHRHDEIVECARTGAYTYRPTHHDVYLNAVTPSFVGWLTSQIPFLNTGGTVALVERWDPGRVLGAMADEDVSVATMVPTQWKLLLGEADDRYDLDALRLVAYAGESMGPALLERVRSTLCEDVMAIYGSTEVMNSGLALQPGDLTEETLGSVGRPPPNVEVRILERGSDDPADVVATGETGQLVVRGPSVAREVWDDPDLTGEMFHEAGWWYSGDLARVEPDGLVTIVGRLDDMIISGGINVHPERVEAVLESHPDIEHVAVVGIPHERWGEATKAFVVGRPGLTADGLETWCIEHDSLGRYQRPRAFAVVEELPRSATGKVDRAALRAREGQQ